MEVITPGDYYFRNGKHFFLYEETAEGENETTRNMIKVTDNYMELTKKGSVSVHMIFECGKKHVTYYHTPYGSLLVGIEACRIEVLAGWILLQQKMSVREIMGCVLMFAAIILVQMRGQKEDEKRISK